jgi:hypothetical protein
MEQGLLRRGHSWADIGFPLGSPAKQERFHQVLHLVLRNLHLPDGLRRWRDFALLRDPVSC